MSWFRSGRWNACVGMCVSVTADTAAAANDDDRYNHQKTKYADTQTKRQAEPVNERIRMRSPYSHYNYNIILR